jgi:hypothetical protein
MESAPFGPFLAVEDLPPFALPSLACTHTCIPSSLPSLSQAKNRSPYALLSLVLFSFLPCTVHVAAIISFHKASRSLFIHAHIPYIHAKLYQKMRLKTIQDQGKLASRFARLHQHRPPTSFGVAPPCKFGARCKNRNNEISFCSR